MMWNKRRQRSLPLSGICTVFIFLAWNTLTFAEGDIYAYPFRNPELPLEARVSDLLSRLTLDEKVAMLHQYQPAIPRLGISAFKTGTEALHGVAWLGPATVFPQATGLGCTWNTELMKKIGSAVGDEARAFNKRNPEFNGLSLWAPVADLERDPRAGRFEEGLGEDPYLVGQMATAYASGMKGDHPFYYKAIPTLKHFFAYNQEKNRITTSVSIDPRNRYEYYLKSFRYPVEAGVAKSIMTAYNLVNGVPCTVAPEINSLVRKQWAKGGDFFVVTDAGSPANLVRSQRYYSKMPQAYAGMLKAGVDSMTQDDANPKNVIREIKAALSQGLISMADIDRAVRNILNVRFHTGEFDPASRVPYSNIPDSVICSKEHGALALQAARESIVLLKNNNNKLPLNKEKIKSIAVIGPLANEVHTDHYSGTLPYRITPLQAIQKKLPDITVRYQEGCDQIAFKSKLKKKYVSAGNGGADYLTADKDVVGESEIFAHTDWGWNKHTFRALVNNKYVSVANSMLSASQDEAKGWFVEELFNLFHLGNNEYALKTAKNFVDKYITVYNNAKGTLWEDKYEVESDAEKFEKEIIVDGIAEAAKAAATSDVAVVFAGNNPFVNGKEDQDRPDIGLPPAQEKLIKEVYKANPNTIVVMISSYPMAINWVQENIPAILYSSHGGQEGANAIADVLFGDYCPAGRINATWYSSLQDLPPVEEYDIRKGKRTYMYFDGKPLYPFGYGLTYTTFAYGGLKISPRVVEPDGEIVISADVKNTGALASDEVVQLYIRDIKSRVPRPSKELKGFVRITLPPGGKETIRFTVPASELAFWDVTRNKYCIEAGDFEVMVGRSSADIRLRGKFKVRGETIPPRDLSVITPAENYDDYSGVIITACTEGGYSVGSINDGDWIMFEDVLLSGDITGFQARVASKENGGNIEIRIDRPDGKLLGVCPVSKTGGWQEWSTVSCDIKKASGRRKLFLVFKGGSKDLFNLSWFTLTKEAKTGKK